MSDGATTGSPRSGGRSRKPRPDGLPRCSNSRAPAASRQERPDPMRFYRALLHLYPASFRAEYGEEMAAIFQRSLRDTSPAGRRGVWRSTVVEIIATAGAVHWDLLRQDLRYTVRTLARSRGFSLTAML